MQRSDKSGRFVLRLPPTLHEHLSMCAAQQGRSLNRLCVSLLQTASGHRTRADDAREWNEPQSPMDEVLFGLLQRFQLALDERLLGVMLFGSIARGQLRASSDIDLLLVVPRELSLERQLYQLWDDISQGDSGSVARQLSPHFVHLPESIAQAGSLWLEVAVEGQIVDDPSGALQRTLIELRCAMAAGLFVRSEVHGHPYWRRAA